MLVTAATPEWVPSLIDYNDVEESTMHPFPLAQTRQHASKRPRKRAGFRAGMAAAAALLALGSGALTATAAPVTATTAHTDLAPKIVHTKKGPTGYTVTFRIYAPDASRVQIKGEWSLERPNALTHLADRPNEPVKTPDILPSKWRSGDVPIQSPNTTDANFPVLRMTEKGDTGVWTYTTPLPSGTFNYGFYIDCTSKTQTGCTEVSDPSNKPWNEKGGATKGSTQPLSQVYVPSDSSFGSVDYSWQAPAKKRGTLTAVTYSSPGHVTPTETNYLDVYTPPGYSKTRADGYPTLYLSHGGGENETAWSTEGDLRNILDNLIASGQIEPMVVVMPNNEGYQDSANNAAYRNDIIDNVIPYVEKHYDVSAKASKRAFSGLSGGGLLTNQFMLYDTGTFGYYGMMSAGFPPKTVLTAKQVTALKRASIFVGGGWQEPIFANGYSVGGTTYHTGISKEVRILTRSKIHVTTDFVNGGHEWYTWRILLKDFVTRVAFWPSNAS